MWLLSTGEPLNEDSIGDAVGFVYCITNLCNGKKYIGKKLLTKAKRYQKNGRKRSKRVASDWQNYYGSNEELKADIKAGDEVVREIVEFCRSKSQLNYRELYHHVVQDVLFHPDKYYNSYVGTRVNRKQLGIK